jgi:uncharacterized repeat protein (TIGR03803 family)
MRAITDNAAARREIGWTLLIALAAVAATGLDPAHAEFAILHAFSDTDTASVPFGSVIHHDGWLYGTTAFTTSGTGNVPASGGVGGGAVYALRPDGSDFRIVKAFSSVQDGQNPFQGLTVSGTSLVGVTRNGGQHGSGALFTVGFDGSGFTVRHHFTGGAGGAYPYSAPILSGGSLYGLTFLGGAAASGVIYGYDLATSAYSVVHDFAAIGGKPFGTLTQVGQWLYGMVSDHRSTTDHGAIFRYRPADDTYEVVHAFQGGQQGGYPYDSLTWDGGSYLYGTTLGYFPFTGETVPLADEGVIFRFNVDTNQYEVIHDFSLSIGDGAKPNSAMLVAPDGSLYGIAHGTEIWGGPGYEYGTLYRLDPDGSNFEVLHTFDSMANGDTPMRSLVLLDDALYGTTAFGGIGAGEGNGTVWTYAVPEPSGLTHIAFAGVAVIIARSMARGLCRPGTLSSRQGVSH